MSTALLPRSADVARRIEALRREISALKSLYRAARAAEETERSRNQTREAAR